MMHSVSTATIHAFIMAEAVATSAVATSLTLREDALDRLLAGTADGVTANRELRQLWRCTILQGSHQSLQPSGANLVAVEIQLSELRRSAPGESGCEIREARVA